MANILKWVQGNDVVMTVWLYEPKVDAQGHPVYDQGVLVWQTVELDSYDEWKVRVKNGCSAITMSASAGEDTGSIIMTVPATLACGDYSIEFTGIKDDVAVRSFETAAFGIVKSNGESNVVFDIVDGEKSCDINIKLQIQPQTVTRGLNSYDYWKQIPGNEDKTLQDYLDSLTRTEQADWNQTDPNAQSFIKNKPIAGVIEFSTVDNVKTTGVYIVANIPSTVLMVNAPTTATIYQTYIGPQGNIYTRTCSNGTWSDWSQPYASKATTLSGYGITDAYSITDINLMMGDKEDKMVLRSSLPASGATLIVNSYYRLGSVGSIAADLPTLLNDRASVIMFYATFTDASPDVNLTPPTGVNVYKQDGWSLEQNATYEVSALWNGNAWILTHVKIATS